MKQLTEATSQPVSALLTRASRNVVANTLLSEERQGTGGEFGLRKLKRCLILGVSFTLLMLLVGVRLRVNHIT